MANRTQREISFNGVPPTDSAAQEMSASRARQRTAKVDLRRLMMSNAWNFSASVEKTKRGNEPADISTVDPPDDNN